MVHLTHSSRPVSRIRLFLLGLIAGAILFAGLNPKEHPFRNGASWSVDAAGITFDDTGMANTSAFLGTKPFEAFSVAGFTMELVIEIPSPAESGFMFIANFHDGEEATQLLLGQWKTWLILMNGDDYDHSRRLPRLSVDVAPELGRPFLFTCTSGAEGSRIYIDGKLLVENSDVHLTVPGGSPSGRLVLGNSVYGKNPWKGRLAGFALHSRVLEVGEIRENHALWRDSGGFLLPRGEGCEMQVPFDEGRGEVAYDRSGFGRDVEVRSDVTFLRRRAFDRPPDTPRLDAGFRRDVLVNLVGFVPFGFVLMGVVGGRRIAKTFAALLVVTAIGFALSAGIEYAQSWFPARNSSTLDLLLNTTGTALGAGAWATIAWMVKRRATGNRP